MNKPAKLDITDDTNIDVIAILDCLIVKWEDISVTQYDQLWKFLRKVRNIYLNGGELE